jgi:hypothetical protein
MSPTLPDCSWLRRLIVLVGEFVVRDYELVNADERELVARLHERLARTPIS